MLEAFVFIVESPSDIDVLEGRREGQTLCESLKLAGVDHEYWPVSSRRTFNMAVNRKLMDAINSRGGKKFPLLHLSMHGDKERVGLTDGSTLTWNEVREELRGFTSWSGGRSLIGLSSCHGYWGIQMAMFYGDEHPFGGIVANSEDANWNDAALAYCTFYHQLFKGAPIEQCVEAMRIASGDPNFYFERGDKIKANWAKSMQESWQRTYEMFVKGNSNIGNGFGSLFGLGANGLAGLPGVPTEAVLSAPMQSQRPAQTVDDPPQQ